MALTFGKSKKPKNTSKRKVKHSEVKKPVIKEEPALPLEKEEVVSAGTVAVPKSEFKNLLNEMRKIKEEKSESDDKIRRLEYAASNARLDIYDQKNTEEKRKVIKLITYEGKVVLSWTDLLSNKCEKNAQGIFEEDQKKKIVYEDGSKEEVPLQVYNRHYKYLPSIVTEERLITDAVDIKRNGDRIYVVEAPDGRVYEVGSNFVN